MPTVVNLEPINEILADAVRVATNATAIGYASSQQLVEPVAQAMKAVHDLSRGLQPAVDRLSGVVQDTVIAAFCLAVVLLTATVADEPFARVLKLGASVAAFAFLVPLFRYAWLYGWSPYLSELATAGSNKEQQQRVPASTSPAKPAAAASRATDDNTSSFRLSDAAEAASPATSLLGAKRAWIADDVGEDVITGTSSNPLETCKKLDAMFRQKRMMDEYLAESHDADVGVQRDELTAEIITHEQILHGEVVLDEQSRAPAAQKTSEHVNEMASKLPTIGSHMQQQRAPASTSTTRPATAASPLSEDNDRSSFQPSNAAAAADCCDAAASSPVVAKYLQNIEVWYGKDHQARGIVELDGWSNDMNRQFGGESVYLVPIWTTVRHDAVTSISVQVRKDKIAGVTDLAAGAGGDYRYITCHRDPAQPPIASVTLFRTNDKSSMPLKRGWRHYTADINSGRGKTNLYVCWKHPAGTNCCSGP